MPYGVSWVWAELRVTAVGDETERVNCKLKKNTNGTPRCGDGHTTCKWFPLAKPPAGPTAIPIAPAGVSGTALMAPG